MNSFVVNCGNGGEWEYERDRYMWARWIANNVPECDLNMKIYSGYTGFTITPHADSSDQAVITFECEQSALIFALIKPEFV